MSLSLSQQTDRARLSVRTAAALPHARSAEDGRLVRLSVRAMVRTVRTVRTVQL
jgi:hypothetical protein